MGRGSNKKAQIKAQIAELESRGRNGLIRAIASFVGLAIVIAIKVNSQVNGEEWATSTFVNMALFILAIGAAAVAGTGTYSWSKCRKEAARLRAKIK